MRRSGFECSSEGFTLMEVLVAFLIMSMAVIYGMRIFGEGARRIADVEERHEALTQAQRSLELALSGQVTTSVSVRPLRDESADWSALQPYLLRSTVDGRTLETIVLLPGQP